MPITQSAKKALRGSRHKKVFNDRRKKTMKLAIKNTKKIAPSATKTEAQDALAVAYQAIDKAMKRGVIKKNTAARKKSRLVKLLKPVA